MEALGAGVLVVGALILMVPLGTCFGAFAGWVVGWFFGQTILGVLGQMGLHDVEMWHLGATAGFFGSFLRTSTTVKSN